jgi:hypothetical protein
VNLPQFLQGAYSTHRLQNRQADEAPAGPLRTFTLLTGERLHGELLRADRTAVEFRWHGRTRFRIPTAAVTAIENPPGVVDRLDVTSGPTAAGGFDLSPVADGYAQLIAAGPVNWRLRFGTDELIVMTAADGRPHVFVPDDWSMAFRQPVRPRPGAATLAVRWTDSTWDVRLGAALAFRGDKPPHSLARIVLPSGTGSNRVTVREFLDSRPLPALGMPRGTDDAIIRVDGDVWHGEFLRTTKDGIELRGQQAAVVIVPWSEFAALHLRSRPEANALLSPVTGRVAEFVGPSRWEPWRLERERWLAATVSVPLAPRVVEHPLLGQFAMQADDIAYQIAGHPRTWQWLHPGPVHLGNNIVPEFVHPDPAGVRVSGTITLTDVPKTATAVSLDAVGLEPRGPGTPATQPFLADLQAGRLRTEFVLNGEPVGDFNSLLNHRPRPGQPARLRLAIPVDRWRTGRNEWQIRQHPASDDLTEFDDCELSRMAWERE